MHRRTFTLALLLVPAIAGAQVGVDVRLAILTDFVKAIGAAGDAISKLTEGFRTLVVAGKDSYKYVAAEREQSRLIDISRRTTELIAKHNIAVIESIDQYIAAPKRTQQDWTRVVLNVEATLGAVQQLLMDVEREDGSFVLEPAYLTLNQVLSGRARLLGQLAAMPAPESAEELALLGQANEKYRVLVDRATAAVSQLNAYVKTGK
ncbi:MAG: hypothetical protein KBF58_13280 [Methyloversatilis sp.]|nr:hypothetical protein [Methyloversatilis sp.]MBP6194316.1 hypothetical protein [Methyloversatilis sp.]MBP9119034.1 hypothetical protein [Methyloversatilis sp.]